MADFKRIKTIGQFPEHQEGHIIRDWDISDENIEYWEVEKEVGRPSLKEGEDPTQRVVLSKEEWKRIK